MKYLLKDVVIFKGHNSRGDYYWLQGLLFNDKNVRMNGERKMYYSTSNEECKLYIDAGVCEPNTELSTTDVKAYNVNDVSLKKELEEGGKLAGYGDLRHINAAKVTWPLNGVWGRINRETRIDQKTGQTLAVKGEWQLTETGQIMEYRELSFYLAIDTDEDTGERIYGQDPQAVANRILERGYKKIDANTIAQQAQAPQAPQAPQAEAQAQTPEELKEKIAALQAQLANG